MRRPRTITGKVIQHEDPLWDPLVAAVGGHHAGWFMWMFEIELDDGSRVHAYKHVSTRCYMHLSTGGRAFTYQGEGRYREIDVYLAADLALAGWRPEEEDEE
jgi:hypothetical protein